MDKPKKSTWRIELSVSARCLGVLTAGFYAWALGYLVWCVVEVGSAEATPVMQLIWPPLRYSLWMGGVTCLICGALAPLVAWSFYRLEHSYPRYSKLSFARFGQILLLVPYCLPTVAVAGMMILTLGRQGLINRLAASVLPAFMEDWNLLYRPATPLLATVWMNLSLGVLLLGQQWRRIPTVVWFQAACFDLKQIHMISKIIIPYSLPVYCSWLLLVFLNCFGSFGLMMMLSGSPAATTLELAAWQSLFVDGLWSDAAWLMFCQCGASLLAVGVVLRINSKQQSSFLNYAPGSDISAKELGFRGALRERPSLIGQFAVWTIAVLFTIGYLLPLFALGVNFISSLPVADELHWHEIGQSSLYSLQYGICSSVIVCWLVLVLVPTERVAKAFDQRTHVYMSYALLWGSLMIPTSALSFGLLGMAQVLKWDFLRTLSVAWLQALSALPTAAVLYGRGWDFYFKGREVLQYELGINRLFYFWRVEWRAIRRWLGLSAAFGLVLSLSDVTLVSFLGDPAKPALTVLISQFMGAYRFSEATLALAVMTGMSAGIFCVLMVAAEPTQRQKGL